MSRIGKQPVPIPSGVTVKVSGRRVDVEGPKGKLNLDLRSEVSVEVNSEQKQLVVSRQGNDSQSRAFHGLTRALLNNMVRGVTQGYEKQLELQGVGYICSVSGKQVSLRVGYANEVKKTIPTGLDVVCPDQTHIHVRGCDKQLVGQFAAELRAVRKPEPYKGKGIRYVGEYVKIKQGKAAT